MHIATRIGREAAESLKKFGEKLPSRQSAKPKGKAGTMKSQLPCRLVQAAGGAAIAGRAVTELYEGKPSEAVKTLVVGVGAYKLMVKQPALVPLAVMVGTISAYDEKVREHANTVGGWVERNVGSRYGGAAAAAGTAVGESLFEGTFGAVGTAIGEGLAATGLWLTSLETSGRVSTMTPAQEERKRMELTWLKAGYY
jgi:hypothetical protein